MSQIYSKCCSISNFSLDPKLEDLLKRYLSILNKKQRDVDAIRMMHHDIWKESRAYPIIKQHRSGSRVERQLRISQMGKQSDIDYTFEVTGIEVNCKTNSDIYLKTSSLSKAYGKIFVTKEHKEQLQKMKYHSQIFTNDVFQYDEAENSFLLKPKPFKENVVRMSGFDYQKDNETQKSISSPSIPGQGAMNEYDVVPCLRLKEWTSSSERWKGRGDSGQNCTFNSEWRHEIINETALFLVPTGNPLSAERDQEFRLSFSLAEIKCFEKISTRIRKYYGLGKYLFKAVLFSDDFIDSYHVKTILLWMVEEISSIHWKRMTPSEFLRIFLDRIDSGIKNQNIRHFFVADCNIFPKHKMDEGKLDQYKIKMESLAEEISSKITQLLRYDLKMQVYETEEVVFSGMKNLEEENSNESYLDGYLTRLLSVITFSLSENEAQHTLEVAVNRIRKVFHFYREDKHIGRIIPMVNATLTTMLVNDCPTPPIKLHKVELCYVDEISEKAHVVFEAYRNKDFQRAREIVGGMELQEYKPNGFGISVTSYHKSKLDQQIDFIITTLEKESRNGKSPRFYLDPFLLIKHIQIQLDYMEGNKADKIINLLKELELTVELLSVKEPYLGKLSYKFAGVYLLHGYKNIQLGCIPISLTIPSKYPLGCFDQRKFAGNFDLR